MASGLVDPLTGLLLGQALGDALGLPFEGLPPDRVARRLDDRPLAPAFLGGWCTGSDDVAHAWAVGQALLASEGDEAAFRRALARGLRAWFLTLPPGIGWATLRAMVRLWVGVSPERSGVASAGNGPAMRAPLVGAWARDLDRVRALVDASTRITHTDVRAVEGARVVAVVAHLVARATPAAEACARARAEATDAELASALDGPLPAVPTGYVVHTVPAALACFLAHPGDVRGAVDAAVRLGGDTDTIAAIAGALAGAAAPHAVPADWLARYVGWPDGEGRLRELAARLASGGAPLPERRMAQLGRNLASGVVAVGHLMRNFRLS